MGSVIPTPAQMCGNSGESPWERIHFPQVLWRARLCFPGRLPGRWLPCVTLSASGGSNLPCRTVHLFCVFPTPPPSEPAPSRRRGLAPHPLLPGLPGPAEWKPASPRLWARALHRVRARLFPPGPQMFISLISQFAHDIFKSFVGSRIVSTISFFMKVLIVLFFKSEIVLVLWFKAWGRHFSVKARVLALYAPGGKLNRPLLLSCRALLCGSWIRTILAVGPARGSWREEGLGRWVLPEILLGHEPAETSSGSYLLQPVDLGLSISYVPGGGIT